MSVSVWTHIPQDQPNDQQCSFRVLISMNYNLIYSLAELRSLSFVVTD